MGGWRRRRGVLALVEEEGGWSNERGGNLQAGSGAVEVRQRALGSLYAPIVHVRPGYSLLSLLEPRALDGATGPRESKSL